MMVTMVVVIVVVVVGGLLVVVRVPLAFVLFCPDDVLSCRLNL